MPSERDQGIDVTEVGANFKKLQVFIRHFSFGHFAQGLPRQRQNFRRRTHHFIADRLEFLVLLKRNFLRHGIGIGAVYLALTAIPQVIQLRDFSVRREQFHDFIRELLCGFIQIAIDLFAFVRRNFSAEEREFLIELGRNFIPARTNLCGQLPHFCAKCLFQIVPRLRLPAINREQFLTENVRCHHLFDVVKPRLREIRLARILRPHHHMRVRVGFLVVVRGVPTKIFRRDVHRFCNIIAAGTEQIHPLRGTIIAEPFGILALQGKDQCPHIARMIVDLLADFRKVNAHTFVREQPAGAFALTDIVHHAAAQKLHAFARCDIFRVTAATSSVLCFVTLLVIRRFQNQFCHKNYLFVFNISSVRMVPFVSLTSRTESLRILSISTGLNSKQSATACASRF